MARATDLDHEGLKTIFLKNDGNWCIGTIENVVESENRITAHFNNTSEIITSLGLGCVKKATGLSNRRLGSNTNISSCLIPLRCPRKPCKDSINYSFHHAAKNEKRIRGNIYHTVNTESLQIIGSEILWVPIIPNRFVRELRIGIVLDVLATTDILGNSHLFANVQFENAILDSNAIKYDISNNQCVLDWSEIFVLEDTIFLSESFNDGRLIWNSNNDTRILNDYLMDYKTTPETEIKQLLSQNVNISEDNHINKDIYRPCVKTRRTVMNEPFGVIKPGTKVQGRDEDKQRINGVVKLICQIDGEISQFAGIEFEQSANFKLEHNIQCENRYECSMKLLVAVNTLFDDGPIFVDRIEPSNSTNTIPPIHNKDMKPKSTPESDSQSSISVITYASVTKEVKPSIPQKHENKILPDQYIKPLKKGILGGNNSCYLDASLFAMFAYNSIFHMTLESLCDNDARMRQSPLLRELMTIAKQLWSHKYASAEMIHRLRREMTLLNPHYEDSFMDAEEFILNLLDGIGLPNFYKLENGGEDKLYQLVLPLSANGQKLLFQDLNSMIKESLVDAKTKLACEPFPVFMLKLPFNNGQQMYGSEYVVPNLEIDLTECSAHPIRMRLFAIICLKHQHYTCIVKSSDDPVASSPWIYMDSRNPDGAELIENFEKDLKSLENNHSLLTKRYTTLQNANAMHFICSNCYICMYM